MKKHMRVAVAAMLSLAGSWQAMAQNYEKGDYGFLYCHMSQMGTEKQNKTKTKMWGCVK